MAVTVTDIGRAVGCSGATVSRALNNSGAVSPKTREAIFAAVRESHYPVQRSGRVGRPSNRQKRQASSLVEVVFYNGLPMERVSLDAGRLAVGSFTHTVGSDALAASRDVSISFYRQIVDGIVAELGVWNRKAVLQITADLASPEMLADINSAERCGVLLVGRHSPPLGKFIEQCLHPLVLVDLIHRGWADMVTTDNVAGIGLAFDHLFAQGHRRIGFVGRDRNDFAFSERFTSFLAKMSEADLPVPPEWLYEGLNRIDQTEEGVAHILRRKSRPSAFLCANDWSALAVIRAAGRLGIKVPQDLSVVGFDDNDVAAMTAPPLTTVRTPMTEMGRQAVRQLMLQIQQPQSRGRLGCCVRMMPELVVRDSTAPCPGAGGEA